MQITMKESDKICAVLAIMLSLILLLFFIIKSFNYIYFIIPIFCISSCLLWLVIRDRTHLTINDSHNSKFNKMLSLLFFILFTIAITSIYFRPDCYERPFIFFIIITLMVAITAIKILYFDCNVLFTIIKIVIIGITLSWSQLLIFPGLLGIDPWWHQLFTLKILNTGSIPVNYSYTFLPVFHLIIAATSLLTGFDYKISMMLSASLIQIVGNTIFIFLLGKYFFNKKIGLLAALLLIIANHHINMSFWSIPNSLSAIFIPIILYLMLKLSVYNSKKNSFTMLSIVFMILSILTHTVTSICIAIVLLTAWASSRIYKLLNRDYNPPINFTIIVFFIIISVLWWSLSQNLTQIIIVLKWGAGSEYLNSLVANNIEDYTLIVSSMEEQIINNLGMFIYFSISFIGIFYTLRFYSSRINCNNFTLSIIGFIPLAMAFFTLITSHSIIEHRWWYFSQILLSIPLATSILLIYNYINKKFIFSIFLFLFFIILTFFMIISPPANIDNHELTPNMGITYGLKQSEIDSVAFFIQQSQENQGPIYTDNYLSTIFTNNAYDKNITIKYIESDIINNKLSQDNTVKIIRNQILLNPLRIGRVTIKLNDSNFENYNKIYNNNEVNAYI